MQPVQPAKGKSAYSVGRGNAAQALDAEQNLIKYCLPPKRKLGPGSGGVTGTCGSISGPSARPLTDAASQVLSFLASSPLPQRHHPQPLRHPDQEPPIPQEVVNLAVGVADQASVGRKPTRSGIRRTHKLQQDAHTHAQTVSPAWSCGSGGNGRIASERSAGIADDLRLYRAHRCWLRLKSWS